MGNSVHEQAEGGARDEGFMLRCLTLAEMARARGETAVGAVLVRGGEVIAEASESNRVLCDPSAHAEVEAVREVCRREKTTDLSDCTLYTTVEPCVLCAYVIRRVGIVRVVYGVPAGQAGGATSHYAILTDATLSGWPAPPEIVSGVLEAECRALLPERRSTGG